MNTLPCGSSTDRARQIVFRVATSGIFVVSGLGHLLRPERVLPKLEHGPVAQVLQQWVSGEVLVVASGPPLLLGGVALLVGWRTRFWALFLLALLVPITVGTHLGHLDGVGPLFKNIALAGALVALAGPYGAGVSGSSNVNMKPSPT